MSVMKPELLSFAVTNYKIKLSCGRALKPRPYDCKVYLFSSAAALHETRLYHI